MIEKKAILFIGLAIVGMFILILVENYSWENKKIREIEEGDKVEICARLESFREIKGVSIMEIEDKTGNMKAISYDKILNLKINKSYCFLGKIEVYEEELEMKLEKIENN